MKSPAIILAALTSFWLAAANAASLELELRPLIKSHAGTVSVAIKNLRTGEQFLHNADTPMPTASLIKFPVMVEAYRQAESGKIDLNEMLTLAEADKVPGSGILTPHFSAGTQISLRDAIRLMIVYSDNTATNLVLERIGLKSVADAMETWRMPHTKIHAKVFRRNTSIFPERSREFGLGSTTAAETVRLYQLLHEGKLGTPAATANMLADLQACDDKTKLAARLPSGIKLAHKSGTISQIRCDGGIIFAPTGDIAICVLTKDNKDQSWQDGNAAHVLIAKIARATYDHFNPSSKSLADVPQIELARGATGELVEALQRTLNERLDPSPELSVDGDFGPATEAAVLRFQRDNDSDNEDEVTGVVNFATWKALGPLLMQDTPVPAPEIINSEVIPKSEADTLDGPPFVTCDAWAIGNGKTGELLSEHRQDRALDIASTTKIMTAYIVLTLAESTPSVLDEIVTFSRRADETLGSTAAIRTGEQLSVRELLFGLLLPSGNDASIAFAEHFGQRFTQSDESSPTDSYAHFVAEMNRTAERLGMTETTFKNPHGLTETGHESSAADLLKLAHAAMQLESFRAYVGTIQHGCTVSGPTGYQRHVAWKNTNQLLKIDGYLGLKTGTTDAAGACLVAYGRRGDEDLIVVVLGAKSSPARYTDTRNLFRWAWNNLTKRDEP
ncbi:MAG TPA: serine hydrolase [Pirellulaceae bacterium]|nr:serine hydrolase [Pirellulaceae bacterium]